MQVFRIQQALESAPLPDIEGEVRRQLDSMQLVVPKADVAITAGSRGIDNIVCIIRVAGAWLREQGARPFISPCMGSHNGATAKGQRAMLESLGITEDATGMEIRASMEVVEVGAVGTGRVYMDRHCHDAAGVLVINRIKLHTCFAGSLQSGLVKMMVVGMGKINTARDFHRSPQPIMKRMLAQMGARILATGKILGGLAILEDGFDRVAELHGLRPETLLHQEPRLLERHLHYFPRLPVDALDVLVVDEIGKNLSGTGMDTNVIGRRGIPGFEDLKTPVIGTIAALTLSELSQGNAIGVGMADYITRRLREAIDEHKTFVNVHTTGYMDRMKIPATLANDQAVIEAIAERYGCRRWMFIPNTLHLGTLFVSEDLCEELTAHRRCTVHDQPVSLTFDNGRLQLPYSGAVA